MALAVRFDCPVYTYEFILDSAGIILDEENKEKEEGEEGEGSPEINIEDLTKPEDVKSLSYKELEKKLEEAIAIEDYETASRIRDELSKRDKKDR